MRTAVAMRRHTMKHTWMLLFSLLFVATDAKDVDPHGVEAFAAVKPGSSEVYKASVLPTTAFPPATHFLSMYLPLLSS